MRWTCSQSLQLVTIELSLEQPAHLRWSIIIGFIYSCVLDYEARYVVYVGITQGESTNNLVFKGCPYNIGNIHKCNSIDEFDDLEKKISEDLHVMLRKNGICDGPVCCNKGICRTYCRNIIVRFMSLTVQVEFSQTGWVMKSVSVTMRCFKNTNLAKMQSSSRSSPLTTLPMYWTRWRTVLLLRYFDPNIICLSCGSLQSEDQTDNHPHWRQLRLTDKYKSNLPSEVSQKKLKTQRCFTDF